MRPLLRLATLVIALIAASSVLPPTPATAESHTYEYNRGELRSATFRVLPDRVVLAFVIPRQVPDRVAYESWGASFDTVAGRGTEWGGPAEFTLFGDWRSRDVSLDRHDDELGLGMPVACRGLRVEATAFRRTVTVPRRCLHFEGRRPGAMRIAGYVTGALGERDCFAVDAPASGYSPWLDPDRRGSATTSRRRDPAYSCVTLS